MLTDLNKTIAKLIKINRQWTIPSRTAASLHTLTELVKLIKPVTLILIRCENSDANIKHRRRFLTSWSISFWNGQSEPVPTVAQFAEFHRQVSMG